MIDKKPGLTSFDTLDGVKCAFLTKKAGHTGTLDKFASGLLVVLVGKGVKLAFMFSRLSKEYVGRIRFGTETDTLDSLGAVIASGPVPLKKEVEAVLAGFRGSIMQAPPEYSAVHINGKRAHELKREGKTIEMKKRPVTVHSLELVSWEQNEAVIRAHVSSGTYIRSLARDIALAAGSRGHLSALERVKVGTFSLNDAVKDEEDFANALHPLDRDLFKALSLPFLEIDEKAEEKFIHGGLLSLVFQDDSLNTIEEAAIGVFKRNPPDVLLGVLERKNEKWGYGHVFAGN